MCLFVGLEFGFACGVGFMVYLLYVLDGCGFPVDGLLTICFAC